MISQPGLSCRLAQLSDERHRGALPGLQLTASGLVADPRFFNCCHGRGLRTDSEGQVTVACQMSARLRRSRAVVQRWLAHHSGEVNDLRRDLAADNLVARACLRKLTAIADQRSRLGLTWTRRPELASQEQSSNSSPFSVWCLAMMAAWRFGLKPHVVILGQTGVGQVMPAAAQEAPQLICVGNVDRLWESHIAEQLEMLLSYAYGSMTPVFMETWVRQPEDQSKPAAFGRSSAFIARRVSSLKSRTPLSWLPPASQSKLLDVTEVAGGG